MDKRSTTSVMLSQDRMVKKEADILQLTVADNFADKLRALADYGWWHSAARYIWDYDDNLVWM